MSALLDFNPSPDLEAKLLDALFSEHHSLASVAALAATSIEALTLWLAQPAVRDRIAEVESFSAWRVRFLATTHLHKSLNALTQVLDNPDFESLSRPTPAAAPPAAAPAPSTSPIPPEERTAILRHRTYETVRRAATTLLQLARFKPIGPTAVIPLNTSATTHPTQNTRAANSPPSTPHTAPFFDPQSQIEPEPQRALHASPSPAPLPANPNIPPASEHQPTRAEAMFAYIESILPPELTKDLIPTSAPLPTPNLNQSRPNSRAAAALLQSAGKASGP